jgi:hypothetical protein
MHGWFLDAIETPLDAARDDFLFLLSQRRWALTVARRQISGHRGAIIPDAPVAISGLGREYVRMDP